MDIRSKKEKYFHGSDLVLDDAKNDYYVLNQYIKPDIGDKQLTFKSRNEAATFLAKCLAYMGDDYFIKRYVCEKISETCKAGSLTGKALRMKTAELIFHSYIIVIPKRSLIEEFSIS